MQIAAAGPLLDLFQFLAQPGVVAEEVVPGLPVALDERVPDEQLAGELRLDLRVVDAAPRHQRQAVQRHPLVGHHRAALGVPVRFAVGALHEMPGDAFDGFGFDARRDPAVQPAGLDEVGDDDPARRPLGEHGARREDELRVAGAGVLAGVAFPQPDVREQAGGQRGVDARRVGGLRRRTRGCRCRGRCCAAAR